MSYRRTYSLLAIAAIATAMLASTGATAQSAPAKVNPFSGSVALGFSQTTGNSRATTTNITNRVRYTMKGWSVSQDLAFFYGEANDKVNANFWNGGFRGERRLAQRYGVFVATRYDRNSLQGISSRFEEGAGVDIRVVDGKTSKLNVALGGSAFQQQLTPGSRSTIKRNFPAARGAFDYRHRFSETAFFQQSAEYLPSLSDTNSYYLNTESSVVAPLVKSLGLKVVYVIRYNSRPPIRNDLPLKTTDTFFSSGITYSF